MRCSAVVFRDESVLLVRRDRAGETDWVLPGGTPRRGESTASCVRREVEEETGLAVTVGNVAFVLEAGAPDGGRRTLDLVFTASAVDADASAANVGTGSDPAVPSARRTRCGTAAPADRRARTRPVRGPGTGSGRLSGQRLATPAGGDCHRPDGAAGLTATAGGPGLRRCGWPLAGYRIGC